MKKIMHIILLFSGMLLGCKKSQLPPDTLKQGWQELGGNMGLDYTNETVYAIAIDKSDNIYISQDYDPGGHWTPLKYDGSTWAKLGTLNSDDLSEHDHIALDNAGNVYISVWHASTISNSTNLSYIAKYNGNTWARVGPDDYSSVSGVSSAIPFSVTPSGTIYASFLKPASTGYRNYKWNGGAWVLADSIYTDPGTGQVVSLQNYLESDASNNMYALSVQNNGKWVISKNSGTVWENTGFPFNVSKPSMVYIRAAACDASGNLYVAIENYSAAQWTVAKWNGAAWTTFAGLNPNGYINTLAAGKNGHIYVGGNFTNTSGKYYIAEWNGSTWGELGGNGAFNANGSIEDIAVDSRGYVYAAGHFTNEGGNAYVAAYKP